MPTAQQLVASGQVTPPQPLYPEAPKAITVNITNMNSATTPSGFYDALAADLSLGEVLRGLELAGCHVLSVAYNGGVLDARVVAGESGWVERWVRFGANGA
ncbi:uncharacterized protein LOC62_07G009780 [Vanrija pseudolonga]|uniref:Uncharacterized protein n=1 Tax=Vanrija pseudolonga TaxID=143232 RepID=A0AAF0YJ92_9TREE|nr:hypothetical protein LOC62_07G009780 [Vanrija pseudolonga]